jgi:hypothetical protein
LQKVCEKKLKEEYQTEIKISLKDLLSFKIVKSEKGFFNGIDFYFYDENSIANGLPTKVLHFKKVEIMNFISKAYKPRLL